MHCKILANRHFEITCQCKCGDSIAKTGAGEAPVNFVAEPAVRVRLNHRIMDLKQLCELGGEVNVTVRLEDLRQWHKELTAVASPPFVMPVPQQPGELYTRKQTIALLGVDSSTLWRWAKSGYLVPVEYGGQRRYRVADVQRILNGNSHDR